MTGKDWSGRRNEQRRETGDGGDPSTADAVPLPSHEGRLRGNGTGGI